jgi:superfamily II DNA or RNA helicase
VITQLWPHQQQAVDLLRSSLVSGKRRPMLYLPTGAGKTKTAAAIVDGALRKGKRVIFTVPALSLVDQTVMAFEEEGIREVGVIQGEHFMTNWAQPVQVASVQTLQRRKIPKADIVVIDEAHRWFDFYSAWMADPEWANVPFIGLSATPWTRGLGKHYDDLIQPTTIRSLIDSGFLTGFRVFAPDHPDLSGVRTVAGDYHEGDLSEAMNKDSLVADIVQTWKQRGEGRPTLCFAVDRAHAKHLQRQFTEAGVPAGYVDAYTPPNERAAIKRQFHSGEFKVVVNIGTLTTGVDWDVRCIILARPTKSEMLFVQIIGRGLRSKEGKVDCLILDHSDTHVRLGFVTDIAHDKLDDGKGRQQSKPKEKEALPKECTACHYLRPPKVSVCPSCGFKAEPQSKIKCEDGELIELHAVAPKASRETKQRWYSMILAISQSRGYRKGWASNQYRQKFGVWPQGLSESLMQPDLEVTNYVRSSMIRYAKRRVA